MGVKEEVRRDGEYRFLGSSSWRSRRLEAREVVNGGAYGLKLVKKVVRNRRSNRGLGLEIGREVIQRKNVGSYHCY